MNDYYLLTTVLCEIYEGDPKTLCLSAKKASGHGLDGCLKDKQNILVTSETTGRQCMFKWFLDDIDHIYYVPVDADKYTFLSGVILQIEKS